MDGVDVVIVRICFRQSVREQINVHSMAALLG